MLPITPPLEPMLCKSQPEIPGGEGWLYEPKWDGFRALIFRDGPSVQIASRNGLPLERYFPEIVEPVCAALPERAVVDSELIIASEKGLAFDSLQMRLHPAESRVRKLSAEIPATVIAFDLLADGDDDHRSLPLQRRRALLEEAVQPNAMLALTPQTTDRELASMWFSAYEGAGLDGLIAKRAEGEYRPGERGWVKIKHLRTVDCVVGGYRMDRTGKTLGSLLLGLYDEEGVLHHVGHTSSFDAAAKREVLAKLAPLEGDGGFGTGRTPGTPSRWSQDRDANWIGVRPELVCEVSFDHLQGQRFRHAARFLRWREDKTPRQCDYGQLTPVEAFNLSEIVSFG